MKSLLYLTIFALAASACSSYRTLSMEDDIYYVPDKEALQTPQLISGTEKSVPSGQPQAYPQTAVPQNKTVYEQTAYENSGYWIGGYNGSRSDLQEIQRIINMYPNGFASFNSNGYDIAMNLSFDPDWNVYTDNGRYWWFPSSSNINLYSSLLFGTYPKYIWTTVWDNPRFDSWAFDMTFNNPYRPSFSLHWGTPGWSFGFGWNSGWYDPWYNGWYHPWHHGWYEPWYGHWHGHYPGWGHNPWHDPWHKPSHPDWNRPQRPSRPLAGQRPAYGGGTSGIRPNGRPNNIYRPTTTRRPSTGTMPTTTPRPATNTSGQYRPNTTTRPTRPSGATTTRPNTPNVLRPGSSTQKQNTTTRPNTYTRPTTTTRPTTSKRQETRPATQQNTQRPQQYTRPQNNTHPNYTPRPSRGGNYQPVRNNTGGGVSRPTSPTRPGRR